MGEITASIFRVDKEEETVRTGMNNGDGVVEIGVGGPLCLR